MTRPLIDSFPDLAAELKATAVAEVPSDASAVKPGKLIIISSKICH
jgi:hypothetical protein